jgi:hypothetical protein
MPVRISRDRSIGIAQLPAQPHATVATDIAPTSTAHQRWRTDNHFRGASTFASSACNASSGDWPSICSSGASMMR